jgi:hypothetical protein
MNGPPTCGSMLTQIVITFGIVQINTALVKPSGYEAPRGRLDLGHFRTSAA